MTRADSPVYRLGVIENYLPDNWRYAWKRTRLEKDELAHVNLMTWPELAGDLSRLLQSVAERMADGSWNQFYSIYSALHVIALPDAPDPRPLADASQAQRDEPSETLSASAAQYDAQEPT